jgi:cytoskeletal protein RodZ
LLSLFAVALRRARLSKSLSISESMKATLLSDKQILGMENDDYSYFYNISYAAIAAETYAKFLGVDLTLEGAPSRDNMQSPRLVTSIDRGSTTKKRQRLFEGRYSPLFWFFLIVIFLLVYVIRSCEDREVSNQIIAVDEQLLQRRYSNEETLRDEAVIDATGASTSEAASVEWVPDVKAVPKPAISDPQPAIAPRSVKNDSQEWDREAKENRFFIIINKKMWISAKDSRSNSLMDGVQAPTPGKRVEGRKPFSIVLDDADAVEIYYLGNRVRPNTNTSPGIVVTVR